MANFRYSDTVHGGQARATAIIDGNVEELFMVRTLEATMEKNKEEGRTLGKRSVQHKAAGWTGTGSMNIYYVTSMFRRMLKEYKDTGKDTYFTITVETDDQGSTIGKQTTTLFYCNINSGLVAKIDIDSAALDEDIDFTFEDWDLLDEFQEPTTV
jgi:Phage tail tube protein